MTIGTITNHHPYGATTVPEVLWDDEFIDRCMDHNDLTDEQWEALNDLEQDELLTDLSEHLDPENKY